MNLDEEKSGILSELISMSMCITATKVDPIYIGFDHGSQF